MIGDCWLVIGQWLVMIGDCWLVNDWWLLIGQWIGDCCTFSVWVPLEQATRHWAQVQASKHDPSRRTEQEFSWRFCLDQQYQLPEIWSHPVLVCKQQGLLRFLEVCSHQWYRFVEHPFMHYHLNRGWLIVKCAKLRKKVYKRNAIFLLNFL